MIQKVADRADKIQPSITLKISSIAKELSKKGRKVIDMSVGEPDFSTPSHIVQAAWQAMKEGKTFYTPTRGIPELLDAIAEKLKNENKIEISSENIIVTPGAKYAIFEAIMTLVERGDEVILLDPSWVSFEACVMLAGGKPIWVKHYDDFQDAPIEDYIGRKTKLIIINTPNNPLGVVYSKNFLKKVADLAIDKNIFVLSDEIYEKIVYESEHVSLASLDEEMLDRTITINGFSKTFSMTGWRLGYAAAPKWVIEKMSRIQSHSVSHPTSFVQYAGIAALKGDMGFIKEIVSRYRRKRDILKKKLEEFGIQYAPPLGTFYMFIKINTDSLKFCEEILKEEYIALTPGSAFGKSYNEWVRISYATSDDNLLEFLNRFGRFLDKYLR